MGLNPGTRLGPYEILSPLGAGGMGEVYRARDTRLRRDVAIKILPETFVNDPERLGRFEREAHVLASLNHPHIAHVYGLEASADSPTAHRAIVMELVEGETLAEKLGAEAGRGAQPLPIDEALDIARQIADALDSAHERGIVHRDLKPANIKIRPDGTVKVLDFGLAKALDPADGTRQSADDSPTITSPAMTMHGVILGTAAYMAPERAKGKAVDKRVDIWAFGCVLYEMLTGRRAFVGDSISDVLAAVIKDSPDWSALPADTPASVRRVLTRCLEKDPKRRVHDIADARLDVEDAIATFGQGARDVGAAREGQPPRMRRREVVAWTVAATLGLAVVVFGATFFKARFDARDTATSGVGIRAQVSLVHRGTVIHGAPQISPDGRRVVYSGRDSEGMWSLWVRELDSPEPRLLTGTQNFDEFGLNPFWSPDSRSIGFFGSEGLYRISASGGGPQKLGDIGAPRGGAWSSRGVIVYAPDDNLGLVSISENGGSRTPVTTLPKDGVWEHSWPSFLPDGRRFLFTAKPINRPFGSSEAGIYLGSLDTPSVQRLLPDVSSAIYSTLGYVLFVREGVLTAAPFDAASGRITGDAASLGEKVTVNSTSHLAAFSIAGTNVFALRNAGPYEDIGQLRVVDRRGVGNTVGAVQSYFNGTISPDGRLIAATISDVRTGSADIWIVAAAGAARRLTTSREWEGYPVWSPDGRRIAYSSTTEADAALFVLDVDGGEPVLVHNSGREALLPRAWSADGRHLLVNRVAVQGRAPDIFIWSFESKTLSPYLDSLAFEFFGAFSPDGHFVTYASNESGPIETWVAGFPSPTEKRRIATGAAPVSWRADGKEILVLNGKRELFAVPITITGDRIMVAPTTLLAAGFGGPVASASRDHSRLLMLSRPDPDQGVAEIRLVTGLLEKPR